MVEQQMPPALAVDERFTLLWERLNEILEELDLKVMLVYLVDLVKPSLLPLLAEQFFVLDEVAWQLAESADARRNLIKNAVELHRYKGTPWAVREDIRLLGFGEVSIQGGLGGASYEGSTTFNGFNTYGSSSSWPLYRLIMTRAITNDQAASLKQALLSIAPKRCRLVSLEYPSVAIRYNQAAAFDGQYHYGSST
ncbi:phage tail protein [Pseudomonas fluorescens]|uniref:phage tail protein n=1 Tax=Pseudomonas fluorescens TaxID=294 RepID=UPI001BE908E7|nr:phage tail protein [Pseudomonas fluorescens]MBT2375762.1 phage tail protein [Pseudomonas fluorescens]